jgi:hypothetical protein
MDQKLNYTEYSSMEANISGKMAPNVIIGIEFSSIVAIFVGIFIYELSYLQRRAHSPSEP